jgi:hypothetical protein
MCRPWSILKPASFPAFHIMEMLKVAALQGLGWTDSKISSLNRLNRTGTTRRPARLMGAERELPLMLAAGRAQKTATANGY